MEVRCSLTAAEFWFDVDEDVRAEVRPWLERHRLLNNPGYAQSVTVTAEGRAVVEQWTDTRTEIHRIEIDIDSPPPWMAWELVTRD